MNLRFPVFLLAVVSVVSGCQTASPVLPALSGWSYEALGPDQFRILVSVSPEVANRVGLAYAGELAVSQGYRSFEVIRDADRPNDGTEIHWVSDFSGRKNLPLWTIGHSFRILCHHEAVDDRPWFDATTLAKSLQAAPEVIKPSP